MMFLIMYCVFVLHFTYGVIYEKIQIKNLLKSSSHSLSKRIIKKASTRLSKSHEWEKFKRGLKVDLHWNTDKYQDRIKILFLDKITTFLENLAEPFEKSLLLQFKLNFMALKNRSKAQWCFDSQSKKKMKMVCTIKKRIVSKM